MMPIPQPIHIFDSIFRIHGLLIACLFWLALSFNPSVNAVEIDSAETLRDGLLLRITTANENGGAVVNCILHNTSTRQVRFDARGPTLGLSFQLTGSEDRLVPMNPEWAKFNTVGEAGKHSAHFIESNGSIKYSLNLGDAYGEAWKSGERLLVSWDPGYDGEGNPVQTGRGLCVTVRVVPTNAKNANSDEPSKSEAPTASDSPNTSEKSPETKQPSPQADRLSSLESRSFMAFVSAVIAAVAFLLWWAVKKRRG